VQGKLSGHHGGDNVVQKIKEFHFLKNNLYHSKDMRTSRMMRGPQQP
jgi:hypothetical protein